MRNVKYDHQIMPPEVAFDYLQEIGMLDVTGLEMPAGEGHREKIVSEALRFGLTPDVRVTPTGRIEIGWAFYGFRSVKICKRSRKPSPLA